MYPIRCENPSDYNEIYELVKRAFETAKVSDGDEQNYVNKLRSGGGYLQELALVALDQDKIIGHVMLTETKVITDKGEKTILLLAPLSVAVEYRSQGIGGELIEETAKRAEKMGYKAIVLIGDPNYYKRYGFVRADQYDIVPKVKIDPQFVLIRELYDDALSGMNGVVEWIE